MTVLQLRVAIATAELKSVTAAAKHLNISQPNASSCLRLLEKELGYPILLRKGGRAATTAKGSKFLEYARQIIDMNEMALNLRNSEDIYRLHLGTVNYYAAAEPFFALCSEHRNDEKTDFSYLNVSVSEGIQQLISRNLDVVAAPVMQHQITGLVSECEKSDIEMLSICKIPAVIMVRKEHPALLDGRCLNITQGSDAMKEYPYIGFKNLNKDTSPTGYDDSDFIQCSQKMFADDTNIRLRMIESSNGFGFGILTSYRLMSQYGLASIPVPGISLELFCLTRMGESNDRGISDYISLLKKEMNLLLNS